MTEPHVDTLARYMTINYETTVEPDDCGQDRPCYVARHPELRGCMSHGSTPEEALANLREVRELYLSTLLENGLTPPLPARQPAVIDA